MGNYLGAVQNWVKLQHEPHSETVYCIVDLHATTLPYDRAQLPRQIMTMAATLIACGIDPEVSTLYQQSSVKEHASLCWVLACLTTMPRLGQLPQYREKKAAYTNKSVPTGLFIYPVLQAADILLHKATHIPIGEDQLQHIQLCTHLARLFNNAYGETFPVPAALLPPKNAARVRSLRKPCSKMSKSDVDPRSRIELLDPPEAIREKIRKAVTDATSAVRFDPESRPGVSNLMGIHSALTGESLEAIETGARAMDTGQYKSHLADVVIESLAPIRARALRLLGDPGHLAGVLGRGGDKAGAVAGETLSQVYERVGFSLAGVPSLL